MTTYLTIWMFTLRNRKGEILEGLTGSEIMVCRKSDDRNLGDFKAPRCKSRKGKELITHMTSKKKFKSSVQNLKEWLKANRNFRGYYTYYGIIGNHKMLTKMVTVVKRLLYKWLNRRSQRRSFTWVELLKKLKITYPVQKPRIERIEMQMEMAF